MSRVRGNAGTGGNNLNYWFDTRACMHYCSSNEQYLPRSRSILVLYIDSVSNDHQGMHAFPDDTCRNAFFSFSPLFPMVNLLELNFCGRVKVAIVMEGEYSLIS